MAKTKSSAPAKSLEKKTVSTNNFIALMALVCILIIGITVYIISLLGKEAFMQTKLIAKKIDVQNKYETKIANAEGIMVKYQQLGSSRDLIEHALPVTPDFPQIVSLIEFAGKSAGVKVKTISPDASGQQASDTEKKESKPEPQKISYSTEIEGSYTKVISFLQNLEFSARPMRVTAAEFKGNDSNLRVTLEVETAYQVKTEINDPMKELK